MGQIVALDYGGKRTGIAVTDDLQLIASPLQTVETATLMTFLEGYFRQNKVEKLVVGQPTDLKGNASDVETRILEFIQKFKAEFPTVEVNRVDERFTSKMASFYISQSGKGRKQRQEKGLIDKVSAVLILQTYLDRK